MRAPWMNPTKPHKDISFVRENFWRRTRRHRVSNAFTVQEVPLRGRTSKRPCISIYWIWQSWISGYHGTWALRSDHLPHPSSSTASHREFPGAPITIMSYTSIARAFKKAVPNNTVKCPELEQSLFWTVPLPFQDSKPNTAELAEE